MKPYGHKRCTASNCRYGCCDLKPYGKKRSARKIADRSRRKAARRFAPELE